MKQTNKRIAKLFQLFALFLLFAFAGYAQTVKLTPVYDGRSDAPSASKVTKQEEALVEKEVRKKESQIREKSDVDCQEDENFSFVVQGSASGSFTKPKTQQKAYLYELCRSTLVFGIGGIVVVENGRVVAHYVYGGNGVDSDIAALPDINQNGFSELLLIGGGTGQGYTQNAVEIIEFTPGGIKSFGIADTYEDNFGTEGARKSAKAYKVSVQTGANPVYFRETYTKRSEAGKWILTGKSQKYSLRRDYEPKYHKIS